jgi:ribosomal protein L7/L12
MQTSYTAFIILGIVTLAIGYWLGSRSRGSQTQMPMMPDASFGKQSVASKMNTQGVHMNKSDVHTVIKDLLARRQLIEAIKFLRLQRGLGLKEAKDYVEALDRGFPPAVDIGD